MINCFLNFNTLTSSLDYKRKSNGYNIPSIIKLIESNPYFNGELKLSGKLRSEKGFPVSKVSTAIMKLKKITTLDVSELKDLNTPHNFTTYCNNLKKYKGISNEDLLLSELNIDNVDFSEVHLSMDNLSKHKLTYSQLNRIAFAITNGASVKHFTLTKELALRLDRLLYHYNYQDLGPKTAIRRDLYTVDNSEPLNIREVSKELISLGFVFKPCELQIVDKHILANGVSCSIDKLDLLLHLGCTAKGNIIDIKSKAIKYINHPNAQIYIPKRLKVNIRNMREVHNATFLPSDKLIYNRDKELDINDLNAYQSSFNALEDYAILGIKIREPSKYSSKHRQEGYQRYLKKLEELSKC